MSDIVKDFINAVKSEKKGTTPYDTPATVTRVDGDTAWVHISGGVDETPVKLTVNANVGDTVQLRVGGGKAWITGNATAPPTDDTRANVAHSVALKAEDTASAAQIEAVRAKAAADEAEAAAEEVHGLAQQAHDDAESAKADAVIAKESAENASEYAARALGNLSTVQNVSETLAWITQHGTMALTTDTELDPTHVYFVLNDPPTGQTEPHGDYRVGDHYYDVVAEPNVADIATYYELSIDESLNNYVNSHLALTNEGLWVLSDVSGWKTLVADDGVYIIDENGDVVTTFGEDITFSSGHSQHIGGENAYITFDSDEGDIVISGTDVTMVSPRAVFLWDPILTAEERISVNDNLGLSESTDSWAYNDLTSAEMTNINDGLDLSEPTSSWDANVELNEYKSLCLKLVIGFQFGESVYVGLDAISLGDNFFVDNNGYLIAKEGKIGGWKILSDGLENGESGEINYINLSASKGIQLGEYFKVTPSGRITAKRGTLAGFDLVGAANGNDYIKSDYKIGGVTWRTWIKSAETTDVGDSWAFSTQVSRDGRNFYGRFAAKSNGEIFATPCDDSGNPTGVDFRVEKDGIYCFTNKTVTGQPNIRQNPSTLYLEYTTWSASSEQIKKKIKNITNKVVRPENLYDVNIVQFQYKDGVIDKDDIRANTDLVGFIIEDLDKKYPIAVDKADENDSKTWSWNSAYIIPPMLKLIQDQKAEIDNIKAELEEIKQAIKESEQR